MKGKKGYIKMKKNSTQRIHIQNIKFLEISNKKAHNPIDQVLHRNEYPNS